MNGANEILPKIAQDGFESVSDIMRTALFEFLSKYSKSQNSKLLSIAVKAARNAKLASELSDTYISKTLERAETLLRVGLKTEALNRINEALETVNTIQDAEIKAEMVARLRSHPLIKAAKKMADDATAE